MDDTKEAVVAKMVKDSLVFSDGSSMMQPYEYDNDKLTCPAIWARKKPVVVFMTGDVPDSDSNFWSRDNMRDVYYNTSSASKLKEFVKAELPNINISFNKFHVIQTILTIDEGVVMDGVTTMIWKDYIDDAGSLIKWAAGKLYDHEGWSEDAPQNLIKYGDKTNEDVCGYMGWIAWPEVDAPEIIIVNHVHDDSLHWYWYDDPNLKYVEGYVNYCKKMCVVDY